MKKEEATSAVFCQYSAPRNRWRKSGRTDVDAVLFVYPFKLVPHAGYGFAEAVLRGGGEQAEGDIRELQN